MEPRAGPTREDHVLSVTWLRSRAWRAVPSGAGDPLLPRLGAHAEGLGEQTAIELGIRRPARRGGVLGAGDRDDLRISPGNRALRCDDRADEPVPGRNARTGEMI